VTAARRTLPATSPAPSRARARRRRVLGVTLIELVCTTAIVAILAMVAIPVVKTTLRKQKELELRRDLRILRGAIDDYKRMVGDNPQLQTFMKTGSDGYPPDLETLVTGLDTGELKQRKIKFLRRIPIDPMTGQGDWIVRSNTQDRNVDFWDRMHVFDVRSRSRGVALDGTKYADW
jgi:general secretion pathway protein G